MSGYRREQVEHHLVVDLNIVHADGNRLVEPRADLVIDLRNSPWGDTAVLVLGTASCHGEGLPSTSLTITKDCSVISLDHTRDELLGRGLVNFILRGIVEDLLELKFP